MNKKIHKALVLSGAVFATSLTPILQAQETVFEEIVVTARKRGNESLQALPSSVSAISDSTLEKMGVADFEDFAYQVPGLTFNDGGAGEKRYIVRGIQSAGQQQVAVYYDEVPLPGLLGIGGADGGSSTTDLKIYDTQRIEVLRGPQGTVFGANSQTGTVRFISKKPVFNEHQASIRAELSKTHAAKDMNWGLYGMLNVPLVEDKLAARIVAYSDENAGYIDNVRLGIDDINTNSSRGIRASLRFQASDNLTLDGQIWHQTRDVDGDSRYHPYNSYAPNSPDKAPASTFFQTGEFRTGDYTQLPAPDEQTIYSLTANWDLGWADMVATGSIYEREFGLKADSTWIILFLGAEGVRDDLYPAVTDQLQSLEQTNFELRISSKLDGSLQWLGGLYYRERELDFRSYVSVVNEQGVTFNPGTPITGPSKEPGAGITNCHPCVFGRIADREIKEKAVFGEISYAFNDSWEVTAGLRWFEVEQTDFGATVFQFALFSDFIPPANTQTASEDKVISKLHLAYTPNDDMTFYAVASQGFRLGGTNNQGIADVPALFESDEIWNYEIGAKTSWLDDRLRVNASLFHIDWDNLQVTGTDPTGAFNFVGNAGTAAVDGLELEVFSRPNDNWDLSFGMSYLPKRELTEDQVSSDIQAPGKAGDNIPRIPELTFNATAQYNYNVSEQWTGWARGEYSYKDESYTELRATSPNNRLQESYSISNLRFGFRHESSQSDIVLFVENVFDERADLFITTLTAEPTSKITNRPRTIGLQYSKQF